MTDITTKMSPPIQRREAPNGGRLAWVWYGCLEEHSTWPEGRTCPQHSGIATIVLNAINHRRTLRLAPCSHRTLPNKDFAMRSFLKNWPELGVNLAAPFVPCNLCNATAEGVFLLQRLTMRATDWHILRTSVKKSEAQDKSQISSN